MGKKPHPNPSHPERSRRKERAPEDLNEDHVLQKKIRLELLMNIEPMMMWKIKRLYLFEAPPPLFWRGGWVVKNLTPTPLIPSEAEGRRGHPKT
ncbi:MAG TPA: hypothetical protein PKC54_15815 [Ferruginibacter sp.]|nr:hypothetical protein [Ferruginibacter sp.]